MNTGKLQRTKDSVDWEALAKAHKRYEAVLKSIDWVGLARGYQSFVGNLPDQLQTLATHGWFISPDHTPLQAIYPTASFFQAEKRDEAHQALCAHFNGVLPEIERRLSADFPARALIFKKAFAAHRAGDFELSIPVFLAQADGIAREAIAKETPKFSIFSKRPVAKHAVLDFIATMGAEEITRHIMEIVTKPMPFTESEGSKLLTCDSLNRNAVLHGTDTGYATPLNSYRAISFLEYVSHFKDSQ